MGLLCPFLFLSMSKRVSLAHKVYTKTVKEIIQFQTISTALRAFLLCHRYAASSEPMKENSCNLPKLCEKTCYLITFNLVLSAAPFTSHSVSLSKPVIYSCVFFLQYL